MGSFSRPCPFLHINYTVDTCCVVSATKTSFLPCILHLRPPLVGYFNNKNTFMVGIGDVSTIYL